MAENTQEGKKTRKRIKIANKQPKNVDEWLDAKVKFPSSYGVSPEGMLIAPPSKPGDIEKIFVLEPRLPASKNHISGEFEKRLQDIKTAEEQFTEARRSLQRTVEAYRQGLTTAADVVIANQQTKEAEAFLIERATSPRSIVIAEPTPEIRSILLENQYLNNKFAEPVYCLKRNSFPWTYFYSNMAEEDDVPVNVGPVSKEGVTNPVSNVGTETAAKEVAASNAKRGAIIAAKTAKRKITFA